MTRWALGVEYDGRAFAGWEKQPRERTVQAVLECAVSRVADSWVRTVCAGRTDAGVHALGQVVHFDSAAARNARAWIMGTNTELPGDVAVTWAACPGDAFHARFAARRRHYRYVLYNRATRSALWLWRAAWEYRTLDLARMQRAAQHLLGEHDFSAFRAASCQARSSIRTVHQLEVSRHGEFVFIDVCANAFLHHMVRNIAGALVAVGTARHRPEWAREVLLSRDRRRGGVTAPACGLYLTAVEYPPSFRLPSVSPWKPLW